MMDNNLNEAHFNARKADEFVEVEKFEEAITCHGKAAEALDRVLECGVPSSSVESITLQRDNHIKQQGVLRLRQYQKLSRLEHAQKMAEAKFPEVDIDPNSQEPPAQTYRPVKSRDNALLRQCFQETDTLLGFLENRRLGSMMNISQYRNQNETYRKLPKDDRMIIEELRCQNDLLRERVRELLKENDALKAFKDRTTTNHLVDRVVTPGSVMVDSAEPDAFCDLPRGVREVIELPPLDSPEFQYRM